MSIELEYAIKQDIRNNPIVREVDDRHRREVRRMLGLAAFVVTLLLVWAWQSMAIVRSGYALERTRRREAAASELNRKLRLELETLQAPRALAERAARQLRMAAPLPDGTIVLERVRPSAPDRAIVAAAR